MNKITQLAHSTILNLLCKLTFKTLLTILNKDFYENWIF